MFPSSRTKGSDFMKKIAPWIFLVSLIVFVISWGVVGLQIMDGDSDITIGASIALICLVLMLSCSLYRAFTRRCPHCHKLRQTGGAYCSYCGQKID